MQFIVLKFFIIKQVISFRYSIDNIRLIPQGTVDNNLESDRLDGLKALDPNYCRQPTFWLHDLCLEVLTVHVTELPRHSPFPPPIILLMSHIWHISSRNVYSYDAVWAEHRTHNLSNVEQIRYVLCHGRGLQTANLFNSPAYENIS